MAAHSWEWIQGSVGYAHGVYVNNAFQTEASLHRLLLSHDNVILPGLCQMSALTCSCPVSCVHPFYPLARLLAMAVSA